MSNEVLSDSGILGVVVCCKSAMMKSLIRLIPSDNIVSAKGRRRAVKPSSFGNNVSWGPFRSREHKGLAGKEPGTASQQPMGTLEFDIRSPNQSGLRYIGLQTIGGS